MLSIAGACIAVIRKYACLIVLRSTAPPHALGVRPLQSVELRVAKRTNEIYHVPEASCALIIGATGLIGKALLPALLASSQYKIVGEYGRRVTSPPPEGTGRPLIQHPIDFENLGASGLKNDDWDIVYITLGTTQAIAGSKEAFTKIDKE